MTREERYERLLEAGQPFMDLIADRPEMLEGYKEALWSMARDTEIVFLEDGKPVHISHLVSQN